MRGGESAAFLFQGPEEMLNERISAAKQIASELHAAAEAIDEVMIRIARLAGTLPAARRDTNMAAIVGQDAMAKVARALAASGAGRQLLTDAHPDPPANQKQVGLGTRTFGPGGKPPRPMSADGGRK